MTDSLLIERDSPDHLLPENLPAALAPYAEVVEMLGAGSPGKVGLLEMDFARLAGKTRMVHHYQRSPMQIFRPMHFDPELPEMAFLFLIQVGGGMLQGDRYRIDLGCQENSQVHFTTQASTKIYRSEQNFVSQMVNIDAAPGSFVEYLPDTTIPYRGSRFYQRINLKADPSATVIMGETLLPGRVAYGEHNDFDLFLAQTEVSAPDGKLLFADTIQLDPVNAPVDGLARMGPYAVLSTLYVVTQKTSADRLTEITRETLLDLGDDVRGGASELPNNAGISVRLVGPSSAEVQRVRERVWSAMREELVGAPAPLLRKA